jgi:hypothetical protein
MTMLRDRAPTPQEMYQAFFVALERLGGQCDRTSDAIMAEMAAAEPDFHRAALAIGCKLDDLVAAFCDEMWKRGFVVARRWTQ